MGNWLTLNFWFAMRPGSLTNGTMRALAIFLIALVVAAIVFTIAKGRKRNLYHKIWRKLRTFSVSNFVIGLFLFFFSYELVPFLSMRFWYLLWGAGMLTWLFFILKIFKQIPDIREKMAKEDEFRKYIP